VGFLLGSFFGCLSHDVRAVTSSFILDNFDSYAVPVYTGTSTYGTWQSKSYGTSTSYDYSSPNSIGFKPGDSNFKMWYNLTNISISGFEFEMYSNTLPTSDCAMFVELKNGTTTLIKFEFLFRNTLQDVYVYDYGSSTYKALTTTGADWYQQYAKFGFRSNYTQGYNPINTVYYYLKNSTDVIKRSCEWQWNGVTEFNVQNINQIYISTSGTSATYAYLDDFILRIGSSPPGNESDYCDVSSYEAVCSGGLGTYGQVSGGNKYVENRFNTKFSGVVRAVDLPISVEQYNQISDNVSDYEMWINGVSYGHPSSIIPSGSNFVLRWCSLGGEDGIVFDDEYPLFSFSCSKYAYSFHYYWFGIGLNSEPSGLSSSTYHNVLSYYHDGFLNGFSLPGGTISMCYYRTELIFEDEQSSYDDLITSSKTGFNTFDTIPIYYFISDYTYTNTIQLWKSGVQQSIQGFPLTVTSGDFNGELSFTPFHNGSYQFRLVRNGVIRSTFNFTVTDPADTDFILAVYPNPCEFNEEVSIGYRFYPDDGSDGFIGISEFSDTSNLSEFSEYWLLSANTSGNKTFFAQTNMYVSLWKETGSSYIRMKIKYLKMSSMFDNTINVGYKSIRLSDAVPSVSQRIYGTQVVQGFDTFVRMNNKLLQYVTDTPFYNVYVDVSKGGNYNVELCMETANGSKVLCSVNFTVSSPAVDGGAGAEAFPAEMKLLFGICCILVAVSCPLMISVKYHVAVPTFVYVVFMAFGIGIGTVLGFLELWLVFLFVVALVAGAVFTIFGHGSSGGGGGGDSGVSRKRGILSRRGGKDYAGASRKADYGVSPKGSPGYLKGPGRRGY
jgi:hypothetical protein